MQSYRNLKHEVRSCTRKSSTIIIPHNRMNTKPKSIDFRDTQETINDNDEDFCK